MKSTLATFLLFFLSSTFANSLQGIIEYKDPQAKGVLFVFAKKFDGSMPMPLAVKRIENPKFPLKFRLSAKDAMIKSIPFKGPFKVIARLTKTGNVMDKSGPEVETKEAITIGSKNIKLDLK